VRTLLGAVDLAGQRPTQRIQVGRPGGFTTQQNLRQVADMARQNPANALAVGLGDTTARCCASGRRSGRRWRSRARLSVGR
jgi:ubiquinone biosynthesis protein UbiJ